MRATLQELAEIRAGYQMRDGLRAALDGTHYMVQAKDIDETCHSLMVEGLERVTPARDPGAYEIKEGDLLFLSRGNRHYATLVENLPADLPTVALYYFFILRLRVRGIDPAFLVWLLNESEAQSHLERKTTGTTIPFITKDSLSSLEVEIPPLDRQVEIGRLNRLACRESYLLRQLEYMRSERLRAVCRKIYAQRES